MFKFDVLQEFKKEAEYKAKNATNLYEHQFEYGKSVGLKIAIDFLANFTTFNATSLIEVKKMLLAVKLGEMSAGRFIATLDDLLSKQPPQRP